MTSYRLKCINDTYLGQGIGFDKGEAHHFHFLTKEDAEFYLENRWGWGKEDWEVIEVPEKAERDYSPNVFRDKFPEPRYLLTESELFDLYNAAKFPEFKIEVREDLMPIPEDAVLVSSNRLDVEELYGLCYDDMKAALVLIIKEGRQ